MHGHGFEIILHAQQDIGGGDMALDGDILNQHWQPLAEQLDYACLNDIAGLENPTSEMIAAWVWERIKPELPELSWVTIYETATAGCHFDGEHYRIWKEFRFESALRLVSAPSSDKRNSLHGHSYLARLHLTGPLDAILGWTTDYGDVKERFGPLYERLDHHDLSDIDGLDRADTIGLLAWLQAELGATLPEMDRIDLFETQGAGASRVWGSQGPALPAQHR